MLDRIRTIAVCLFVCAAAWQTNAAPKITPTGRSVDSEVLVKIKEGASDKDVAAVHSSADADQKERVAHVQGGTIWRVHSRTKNTEALTAALAHNPNIEYIEPNYIVQMGGAPNDPNYNQQWPFKNSGQTPTDYFGIPGAIGADIDMEPAWSITTGSSAIVVGVVDTGIDYTHSDLAANVWSNPGGKGNVACGAGTHGFNAITKLCDPMDDNGHGTHVSGTIGAVGNNGTGVTGVNWTTSIMGLKFLDPYGYGTTANAVAAIEFAVQAKIDGVNVRVLSNSWGGGGFSKALLDEINRAAQQDILFVAAAGNSYSNNDVFPNYPSNYVADNIIAVAATDNTDTLAYFSNYGATTVHLAAPGVAVYSTMRNGTYGYLSGTSMATPHVSGVAALVLAHTPSLTTAQVKSAILDNTDPLPSLANKTVTGGRLNAARALGLPARPTFSLTATPAFAYAVPGSSVSFALSITPSNGFTGPVTFSITGLPTGVQATFDPASTTTTSTLTLATSPTTPITTSYPTVTATDGNVSRKTSLTLITTATVPVPQCPAFGSQTISSPTGGIAHVRGDFNRDGRPDLAIVFPEINSVGIDIGTGNASFSYRSIVTVGSQPLAITTGDFDGDGVLDLATANSGSANVTILKGTGDGAFIKLGPVPAGATPFAIATADLNGDGVADLIVANNASNTVSVLLGHGDGTFAPPVPYSTAGGPYAVVTEDLNRDGKLDVAVVSFNGNKVSVLMGNGDGTLAAAADYATGTSPTFIVAADLNGDGIADLATSNSGSNNVSVLTGKNDGTFNAAVNYNVGDGPISIAAGDINNDGAMDLLTSNNSAYSISLLLNSGGGTFRNAVNYSVPSNYYYPGAPGPISVIDLNGDGRSDVIVNTTNATAVLVNTSGCSLNCGTLASETTYGVGSTPSGIATGDFNRDGATDVAITSANSVEIRLGNGDSTFQSGLTANAGTTPSAVGTADFNRDGKLDLAVTNSGSNDVSILLGNGDGTFQTATSFGAGTNPSAIAIGDVNGDGKPDLAIANGGANNVSILMGHGDGTFDSAVNYTVETSPRSLALGDFNGDGRLDLVVANYGSNTISFLAGNGNGTFQNATSLTAGTAPSALFVRDFNRDGKLDFAATMSGDHAVWLFRGNGNGTFQTFQYEVLANPIGIGAADLNQDGTLDLVIANHDTNYVSVLKGTSTGTFAAAVNTPAGNGQNAIVLSDFNRDGKTDIALINGGDATLSILRDTCPAPDVAVTSSHTGNFVQGGSGTYTVVVTNVGSGPTTGTVSITDTLPAGLNLASISGSGWTCPAGSAACSRNDSLAAGGSYPALTVSVNVLSSASATITNAATVSGGGEVNTLNDSASDPTVVTPAPNLSITLAHGGSFLRGATGRTYTLTVRNNGGAATSGLVTVTDTLPAGLTATGMTGSGWSCAGMTCTRSDVLSASTSYPAITLTVNVASNAASLLVNTAVVSGGGETKTTDDTALDPTEIWTTSSCHGFGATTYSNASIDGSRIVLADFNGDGRQDLAIASYWNGKVSVLLSNGDGTFGSPVQQTVSWPSFIVPADMNHDGKIDLVIGSSDTYKVSVLLGNGDGTLGAATEYSVSGTRDIRVADLNADGVPDVAVLTYNGIAPLLGNGDGTLLSGSSSPVTNGRQLTLADVNGDSILDAVVAKDYSPADTLVVLLGVGDGTFQTPTSLGTTTAYSTITTGDFNRDGIADLAAARYGTVDIFLGVGDGTFGTPTSMSTTSDPTSIMVRDYNGDGITDLIVSTYYGLMLWSGNGNGTFQTPVTLNSASTYSTAIGDFNGDGLPDLAFLTYGSLAVQIGGVCNDLSIYKSHYGSFQAGGDGAYTITVSNSDAGTSVGTVTVTDTMPAGLIATALYGYGWSCDLPSVTCTRSDSLAPGASYSPITVNVKISPSAPTSVVNVAKLSGGSDSNLANNTSSDPTTIVYAPDLAVTTSNPSTLLAGQTGKTLTLNVGNVGNLATTGTIVVTDTVSNGLVITAMSGQGWNCTLSSHSCSRNDALAATSTFPPITVTLDVKATAYSYESNSATVSTVAGESNTYNNYTYWYFSVVVVPGTPNAIATSPTQVSINWSGVSYASGYEVLRSTSINGPYVVVGTPIGNNFFDTVPANATYLYKVRASDGVNTTALSAADFTTAIAFTDDPPVARSTRIKATHLAELRTAVNLMRAAAGVAPVTFTDPSLAGLRIKALHITELRTELNAARALLGGSQLPWSEAITAGTKVKTAHLLEMRSAVR